ncbi:MAG: phospho-N-acetylmuramoyl-pentapeptide-transferase [Deltaproteobacteria bacterium]|nr:phospho-N-acetylmuramoyl-pentapeptide-transferase [Deltaproteobacteria bacterium]
MLEYLLYPFAKQLIVFHVLKYITFRTLGAMITSLVICMVFGNAFIRFMSGAGMGQVVRDEGPKNHKVKKGTPTMGGVLIIGAIAVSTVLWMDITNVYVWILLFALLGFGAIGFVDDFMKLKSRSARGLKGSYKFVMEFALTIVIIYLLVRYDHLDFTLTFPFFKKAALDLGWTYFLFVLFVIIGTSNAVNLTDGQDGLAIVPVMTSFSVYAVFAYVLGNIKFSEYLMFTPMMGTGEIATFIGAVIGASLGFLWFNTYPAELFMGDVGSLGLGGGLFMTAVVLKQEILLGIVGGVFVAEALSVITQVGSFKLSGRRLFAMAPIHHHFELKGWDEPKITVRFWIISILLALIGLATLKLR